MNTLWIERLKARLRATGMTQSDLAKALGCTRGAVGHYLSGRRKPSLEQLAVMAKAVGLNPAWLQFGSGPAEVREAPAGYAVAETHVPVLGDIRSGPQTDDSGKRATVFMPSDCYALTVVGSDFAPRLYEGDILMISPGLAAAPGTEVYVRFRSGETNILTLLSLNERQAVLEPLLTKERRCVKPLADVEIMHSIVAVISPAILRTSGREK